ncbi:hypothetical protein [Nonomuraea cavernae]|uniref:Uncharacterized protein n=1 Tax=Nonomuraea cavernae TaxID=2045107 RepID=A0A917YPR9_9ACTN|nr:hypothetical protein [Nonomuraea cavernae]MCA2184215.1 hypothetical protein [Nonomuraea cavernae]GGO62662.1 hypothetical protein GCM10012289_07850 [Nonomuraea cavernae]
MTKISIGRLNPVTDDEVAALVSRQSREELAEHITATTPEPTPRSWWRRRLLVGLPLAAAMAAAVVAVSSGWVGPQRAEAAALSFQREGGYLIVRVQDPVADPERYQEEFRQQGMDIDLELAPTSPDRAGSVLFMEDGDDPAGRIETIEGPCGELACGVAVKVPVGYRAHASIVFGRAARPGEMYETGQGDEPGAGIGLPGIDKYTVAEAVAILRARNVPIEYRYSFLGSDRPYPNGVPADKVDPGWYVHDGLVGSENQAILFVGPEPEN